MAPSQLVLLGYELMEAGAALEAVACNHVEAALMWLARHHVPFGTTAAPLALLGASPTQLAFNTPPASVTMLPTMVPLPERCGPGGHPYGDATSCES